MLVGKYIPLGASIRKKNLKINDLGIGLKKLGEKKQQIRLKTSRRKEIINIETEINDVKKQPYNYKY